jgi:outer membrane lipoprotein LolB
MNVMRLPRRKLLLGSTAATLLLMGCAPRRPPGPRPPEHWSGRLSLSVRSEPAQSFSAGFELSGRPEAGELMLSTPLGTTLAQARWSPGQALLVSGAQERRFNSIDELLREITGTTLPLAALFDWLRGIPTQASGWEADLAHSADGRLVARRSSPAPLVELRLLLDL